MDHKEKFAEAALMRLRSEALEHKVIIEVFFSEPLDAVKNERYLTDIVEHAKAFAICNIAYGVIQEAYLAKVPAPPPEPERTEPLTEEELMKRSVTFRKSQEGKVKKAPRKTRKKKDT
jgi:hypothetical protein